MNHRLVWKNRPAMLRRARRIALAHWRNRILEPATLDTWFDRHVSRYCAYQSGRNVKPTNMARMRQSFWRDVFDNLLAEVE